MKDSHSLIHFSKIVSCFEYLIKSDQINSFKVTFSNLFICFFSIHFLISKYKSVIFIILNSKKCIPYRFSYCPSTYSVLVFRLCWYYFYISFVKCRLIYLVLFLIKTFLLQGIRFCAALLLWLLIIGGFILSLVSLVLLLVS